MLSSLQSIITKNQFSLPVICLLSIAIWLFTPTKEIANWEVTDYGLWSIMPLTVQKGFIGSIIGLAFTAITVYAMVEFSNSLVLLRVSSRMLSSTLAIFMALALCLHKFQPAHIVMLASLLSYASLFSSYQKKSPALSFGTHFFLALEVLVCPKLILFIVPFWMVEVSINSLSFRCFLATLFALITPFWFFFAFAVFFDRFDIFTDYFVQAFDISKPVFSGLKESQVLVGLFTFVSFLIGSIGFFVTKTQDKLRQRTIFSIVIFHGLVSLVFGVFMPQCYNMFLGLLIIDTSIIAGRFWVVCDNHFTHNLFNILTIVAIIIYALSVNM